MSAGVLIAGAGLAGQRCCELLRARGWDGPIRLVGEEPHAPYDRPPLSKALLEGRAAPAELALRPRDWYAANEVDLVAGTRAVALDPVRRTVALAGGGRLPYEHLVIATGGIPRRLPLFAERDNVYVLRTLDDALALRTALVPGARLVVVGGGLVGLEVAATARRLGLGVTVVEAGPAPLAAVLGPRAGRWVARLHAAHGVTVIAGMGIAAVRGRRRVEDVELADGRRLPCDVVVLAVGMQPATGWLEGSGLPAGAVPVDAAGRTALPGVFAAGDAAGAGHWEAAARHGGLVAATILGVAPPATAPPSFWSDQHGVRLQFAGTAEDHDAVEVDGDPPAGDARAVFLRRGRPIGGLLLGRPRELPALRRLLREAATHQPERNAA